MLTPKHTTPKYPLDHGIPLTGVHFKRAYHEWLRLIVNVIKSTHSAATALGYQSTPFAHWNYRYFHVISYKFPYMHLINLNQVALFPTPINADTPTLCIVGVNSPVVTITREQMGKITGNSQSYCSWRGDRASTSFLHHQPYHVVCTPDQLPHVAISHFLRLIQTPVKDTGKAFASAPFLWTPEAVNEKKHWDSKLANMTDEETADKIKAIKLSMAMSRGAKKRKRK